MDDFRIAYVGDFSGATPSAASAAEAYILDSLPIDFVNTTRTSLGIRADVFADSSQDIKSLLVPLIGASQAQTVISQGSGTKYDFTRVGAANYSTQLAAEPSTLTAALALYNDDNGLGYTKNRELWDWYGKIANGTNDRRDGAIVLMDEARKDVLRWEFVKAWPNKVEGPTLNATNNEVSMESVELCHEGLEIKLVG